MVLVISLCNNMTKLRTPYAISTTYHTNVIREDITMNFSIPWIYIYDPSIITQNFKRWHLSNFVGYYLLKSNITTGFFDRPYTPNAR